MKQRKNASERLAEQKKIVDELRSISIDPMAQNQWLIEQLAYARSDGPIRRMNDALNAAQRRNQTIQFLAEDAARCHGVMRRQRGEIHNERQVNKDLRRRLVEARVRVANDQDHALKAHHLRDFVISATPDNDDPKQSRG